MINDTFADHSAIKPNKNVLVSLIIVGVPSLGVQSLAITEAVELVAKAYTFYEILLITGESGPPVDALLNGLSARGAHVRLLQVDGNPEFDELAIHGYRQSIGDVVVLASSDELPYVDLGVILGHLVKGTNFLRLRRETGTLIEGIASNVVGLMTGLAIDLRYYRTLGLSRLVLSDLLASPDRLHLVRFTASRFIRGQKIIDVDLPRLRTGWQRLVARTELLSHLLSTSSVRMLRLATIICVLISILTLALACYPLLLILFRWDVAEGYSSTVTLICVIASFQSAALATLTLGLSRLLERQDINPVQPVTGERSSGDLFGRADFLNVESADDSSGRT